MYLAHHELESVNIITVVVVVVIIIVTIIVVVVNIVEECIRFTVAVSAAW
jgi:hypothetical protein